MGAAAVPGKNGLHRLTRGFLRRDDGAVAVEYAVLIGMVSLIVIGVITVAATVTGLFDALPTYFSG
ncbi:MAG TPA: hypothetical protein PKA74_06780 [Bauldia sp.]|nr:hypothetical protein [Bauldia sp.]